jgi:hypothetical protein
MRQALRDNTHRHCGRTASNDAGFRRPAPVRRPAAPAPAAATNPKIIVAIVSGPVAVIESMHNVNTPSANNRVQIPVDRDYSLLRCHWAPGANYVGQLSPTFAPRLPKGSVQNAALFAFLDSKKCTR